jgi:para-aminobenzoate synthetase
MRTLLVDNHDSFTWNLFHLISRVVGEEPLVVRNDAVRLEELRLQDLDAVVISPGPGHPGRASDLGLSAELIAASAVPVLGVCLGHQAICHLLGAEVGHAPQPVHGQVSTVHHRGTGLFAGLPDPLAAVRYHSLAATDLPDELEPIAWTPDSVLMAVAHRQRPLWGVQFHPESILTEHGARLVANFAALVAGRTAGGDRHEAGRAPAAASHRDGRTIAAAPPMVTDHLHEPAPSPPGSEVGPLTVLWEVVDGLPDPETAFLELIGGTEPSFWLDSSARTAGRARFSFLGDATGPLAERVTYDVARSQVTIAAGTAEWTEPGPFLDWLGARLDARRVPDPGLPFGFAGGYVGWLGYELKAETGGDRVHHAATPDAALLFVDRFVAFDHDDERAYAVAVADEAGTAAATEWLRRTAARLARLARLAGTTGSGPARSTTTLHTPGTDRAVLRRHPPERYLELISLVQREIRDGETYEVCLTNQLHVPVDLDPLAAHLVARRTNPSPYGALIRLPDVGVVSSSPERFLRVDTDGTVEARPIKGTRRRGRTAEEDLALRTALGVSVKDRAENLMIVDLLRNDLGSVCQVGTVEVPELFVVESFTTVHQLVSTVRGRLRGDRTATDVVRAAFPGGSMTGAPKERTLRIIDRLEDGPRGPYSGALGWFSLTGATDLSIVIRTLVCTPGEVTIGTGGAIVALSDPVAELEETELKAEAALRTVAIASRAPLVTPRADAG